MKYLAYLIILILLCGLNVGLAPIISVYGQSPNFLFLFVFVLALDKTDLDFLPAALLGGLFLDFFSGSFLGSCTLALLVTAFLLNQVVKQILALELNLKYLSLIFIPAYGLFILCFGLFSWFAKKFGLSHYFAGWDIFSLRFPVALLYNLLFLYPIFIFTGYLKSWINKYIVKEYKIR